MLRYLLTISVVFGVLLLNAPSQAQSGATTTQDPQTGENLEIQGGLQELTRGMGANHPTRAFYSALRVLAHFAVFYSAPSETPPDQRWAAAITSAAAAAAQQYFYRAINNYVAAQGENTPTYQRVWRESTLECAYVLIMLIVPPLLLAVRTLVEQGDFSTLIPTALPGDLISSLSLIASVAVTQLLPPVIEGTLMGGIWSVISSPSQVRHQKKIEETVRRLREEVSHLTPTHASPSDNDAIQPQSEVLRDLAHRIRRAVWERRWNPGLETIGLNPLQIGTALVSAVVSWLAVVALQSPDAAKGLLALPALGLITYLYMDFNDPHKSLLRPMLARLSKAVAFITSPARACRASLTRLGRSFRPVFARDKGRQSNEE